MAKKLKALAGGSNESQLAQTIKDSAHQIWLAGLGAFAKAQEEGTKVFEALVKEGETIQKRTREAAEDKVAEARKVATGTWDKLENVFEERVARALNSLNVPTKKDIDALSARIAELTAATKKLSNTAQAEAGKAGAAVKDAVGETAEVVKITTKKVAGSAKAVKDAAMKAVEEVKTDLAG
ncbi:MAG: phasin family protein [Siculibacillus sp.]|nr:phasin family protein [Siculibacillus sp.]